MTCKHDYVVVHRMRAEELAKQLSAQDDRLKPEYILNYANMDPNVVLRDKVCMNCKYCITELTDFKIKIKNMTNEDVENVAEHVRAAFLSAATKAAKSRLKAFEARQILDNYIKERDSGKLQKENK